jgi:hypothetical protein
VNISDQFRHINKYRSIQSNSFTPDLSKTTQKGEKRVKNKAKCSRKLHCSAIPGHFHGAGSAWSDT